MSKQAIKSYLAKLSPQRREAVEAIRAVIRENIDDAFEEVFQYGMPAWALPHSRYPAGYHCDPSQPLPFASVASQKNHIGLYLFCIYGNPGEEARFRQQWKKTGKRLDMGKSCIRFKRLEDVPLEVIGNVFKRMTAAKFVKQYEAALASSGQRKATAKKATAKKATAKKATAKKTTAKKTTAKKATAKKATAKKATAKKTTAKKTTAKKTTAKKATAKKATAKKTTAKKATAKKATRKPAAVKATAKKAARRPAAKKVSAKKATRRKTAP